MKRNVRHFAVIFFVVATLFTLAICAGATELKTGIGTVTAASGLNLRAKANTDSAITATAAPGDQVVIIRKSGDWYLVDYNLYIGYMRADYVTVKEQEDIDLGIGATNPAVVNMRSEPSLSSSVVMQLNQGKGVEIYGLNNGWYKVQYYGTEGYIRSDLVTLTKKPPVNSGSACPTAVTPSAAASSASSSSSSNSSSNSSSSSSSSSSASSSAASSSSGASVAAYAKQFLGYPYVWGGASASGFDCSGFVYYVYGQFGCNLYRTASAQLANGTSVSRDNLQPGDLVFFANTYSTSAAASHVGIYLGNNQFIHSANSSTGVTISSLSESYYASRYVGARRIVG